jgi:hypothetical protein
MHRLQGREYKLLLDYARFRSPLTISVANKFWQQQLVSIIDRCLDAKKRGGSRAAGEFGAPEERVVRFWDTHDGIISSFDYALRERVEAPDSKSAPRNLTLKLRMPDMFVVATSDLAGRDGAKTVFEEDIGPLEVASAGSSRSSVFMADPLSMRSRFSLSTSDTCSAAEFTDFAGLSKIFPSLEANLKAQGVSPRRKSKLRDGATIRETVYKGARVKLGAETTGKFTMTIWEFASQRPIPGIAEISFKYGLNGGSMPGESARRAYLLFIGLQQGLGKWLNLRYPSKTELALPSR